MSERTNGLSGRERYAFLERLVRQHPESAVDIPGDLAATAHLATEERFGQLEVLHTSHSAYITPSEMGLNVLKHYLKTGKSQKLILIGPLSSMKTLLRAQMIEEHDEVLEAIGASPDDISSTTLDFSDALEAGKHLYRRDGSTLVNEAHSSKPDHISNLWDEADFDAGTLIYENGLYMAEKRYKMVFGEAACIGGYRMIDSSGHIKIIGKNRGTTAVRNASRHQGRFARSSKKSLTWLIANTALPNQYERNLERRRTSSDDPQSPGGNLLATEIANAELEEAAVVYSAASGNDLPDLRGEGVLVHTKAGRLFIWRDYIIPWLLGPDNFNISRNQALVCENSREGQSLTAAQIKMLKGRSFFRRLKDEEPDEFQKLAYPRGKYIPTP